MVSIVKIIVGQINSNCFLVIDSKRNCLIIDPGDDAEYIKDKITSEEVNPSQIIATHGHFDHVLAAAELKLVYKIPFLMNKRDNFLLKRVDSSAKYFLGIRDSIKVKVDRNLEENNQITLNDLTFSVIETPGHTPGSISLYSKKNKIVFVGDTLFSQGGVGRTDFKYGSLSKLNNSIKKILSMPEDTKVYCGHGEETDIKSVKGYHRKLINGNII